MAGRNFDDFLKAFIEYCRFGEAPPHLYFWVGVSTVAGALRRHVWIDQVYFKWYPNMYIIMVAPPGIVSKTTTTSTGMDLLRQVPGIKFGASVVTWEALVQDFTAAAETFEHEGENIIQSALTIESGEFGNLFDPKDRKMVDVFVTLWDSKDGKFEKKTKMAGNDTVVNPWINLIACTTPSWIAENFNRYLIGGGFTSRSIFVYAEKKHQFVAYPAKIVKESGRDMKAYRQALVQDLEHISINLTGEYVMTPEAIAWGEEWYERHYSAEIRQFDQSLFGGYVARKQTHIHKLAMVIAAARSDRLILEAEHLQTAAQMITDLEPDMHRVFSDIGKSEDALNIDKLISLVRNSGGLPYDEAYRQVFMFFPSARAFEEVLTGAVRSGLLKMESRGGKMFLAPGPAINC